MFHYRAVFAQGRAYDKLCEVERRPPQILFVGNSRTDNGIDPRAVERSGPDRFLRGFNLGLPGANAIVYHGEIRRLDDRGRLGNFLRLWSYSGNLRQLREPDKALRFVEASARPLDPVGGAAAAHRGYRVGFGAAQNAGQVAQQESAAVHPPAPSVERFLWRAIDRLQSRGVRVFVTLPPLRDRPSVFVDARPEAAPYRALLGRLQQRGVIVLPTPTGFGPDAFINAGHLNDRGAQRYSAELGRQLAAWKDP